MLVLLVVFLAGAAVCARLGIWQLDRAEVGREQRDRGVAAEQSPAPLADVLAPQTSFTGDLVGRHVTVTGAYEADGQLLVADRALEDRTGSIVLTPLRVVGGSGDGAVLPVARGWVASPDDAPAPPAGEVTLTGYLQASEAAGALDVDAGTAEGISTAQLVNVWGGPIWSGYLVLDDSSAGPDDAVERLPAPQAGGGEGLDLRNLGYALQWWIFGLFAVGLWIRMVRDEAAGPVVDDDPAEVRKPAGGAAA
jgi:cytochrome oxidase assembly protein ShyY1